MVRDVGCGLEPLKASHKLFEAFYTTRSLGVGLSVSHSIIQRHGRS